MSHSLNFIFLPSGKVTKIALSINVSIVIQMPGTEATSLKDKMFANGLWVIVDGDWEIFEKTNLIVVLRTPIHYND